MKKCFTMAQGVTIAMAMIGVVCAADNDLPRPIALSSWTGVYAGLDAGLIFNNARLRSEQLGFTSPSEHCNTRANYSSFFPGLQLGYLHQFQNSLVTGLEANVTLNANPKGILSCKCPNYANVSDRFLFKNQMQSSLKGRGGFALNWNKRVLFPYLTTGFSFASAELTYTNEGGDYYSQKNSQAGWLIGAGIEWSFRENWSLRAEYSYVDYGTPGKLRIPSVYGLEDPNGNARLALNANNASIGISYWI